MGTGKRWSVNEQTVLCAKWITASEDSSVGNGQKADVFWGKIAKLFNEGRHEKVQRSWPACKSHFQDVISFKVSKFFGYHKKVISWYSYNYQRSLF